MIVVDASALICLLLNNPPEQAREVRGRLRGERLHAPHLIDIEVAQSLRRFVLAGRILEPQAHNALRNLTYLRVSRYPHVVLLERVWQFRSNLSAYDALYVALAELLDAPLLTLDARMARAGVGTATIEVI